MQEQHYSLIIILPAGADLQSAPFNFGSVIQAIIKWAFQNWILITSIHPLFAMQ